MPAPVTSIDTGGPAELIRGATTTIAPVLRGEDGATITPSTWSAALYRGEVALLTASGTGAASWAIAIPATYTLADDYQIRWAFTWSGGRADPRQHALVCRSGLHPTLAPADVYTRAPALNPAAADPLRIFGAGQSVLTVAAAAWRDVLAELRSRGVRPHLVTSAEDLLGVHLARTLQLCYQSAASTIGEGVYLDLSERYGVEYAALWSRLTLRIAPDSQVEGPDERRNAAPLMGGSFVSSGRYTGIATGTARGVR